MATPVEATTMASTLSPPPEVSTELHVVNRQKLIKSLQEHLSLSSRPLHGFVFLQGGEEQTRYCTDHTELFRQESYFAYLFGVQEPGFYGAIDIVTGKSMLFAPRLPAEYAVWLGEIKPLSYYKERYMVDSVFYTDEVVTVLHNQNQGVGQPLLFLLHGLNTDSNNFSKPEQFVANWCMHFKSSTKSKYGGHVSTIVESVNHSRLLLCNVDVGELENLRSKKNKLEEEISILDSSLKLLQSEQRHFEDEAAQLHRQREDILNIAQHEKKKCRELDNRAGTWCKTVMQGRRCSARNCIEARAAVPRLPQLTANSRYSGRRYTSSRAAAPGIILKATLQLQDPLNCNAPKFGPLTSRIRFATCYHSDDYTT